jgi:chromosome segregation ATPase
MEKEEEERKYSAIAAELEIELEAKKMELTTLQKERARMYNEMSYQIAHLTKGLEECKRDRDSYFSDARAVTDTLGDTEEQLEETEKKLKAAEKSLKQAQADRDLYSLQLKAAQNELLTASQELSGFKNRQLWESMEAKESNEALSMMTKEEVQQLELDLESARAVVKEKESEVASLTNTVETLRASSKQIEQTYRSQIEKIQEQFADLQKKTQEQQQQLQQEIMAFTQAGIPNP